MFVLSILNDTITIIRNTQTTHKRRLVLFCCSITLTNIPYLPCPMREEHARLVSRKTTHALTWLFRGSCFTEKERRFVVNPLFYPLFVFPSIVIHCFWVGFVLSVVSCKPIFSSSHSYYFLLELSIINTPCTGCFWLSITCHIIRMSLRMWFWQIYPKKCLLVDGYYI